MSAITIQGSPIGAFTRLATSVADCSDTASETTVVTVTVPKNTWNEGEVVNVFFQIESKQNSGGNVALTLKAKCNSSSITVLSAASQGNSATVGRTSRAFAMSRRGSDVLFFPMNDSITLGSDSVSDIQQFGSFMPTTARLNNGQVSTDRHSSNIYSTVDFTADVVITFTAQWASANANTYFNVKSVIANKANR